MRRLLKSRLPLILWAGIGFSLRIVAEDLAQPQEPPKIEEPKENLPIEKAVVLSPEIQLMQKIEPGFLPKDDRAVQLFLLQKAVADGETALKQKQDLTLTTRENLARKFREDLSHFVGKRTNPLEARLNSYIDEAIKYYEIALKNNPDDKGYARDSLYNLGRFYFERDERDYFDKLAAYNLAREQGREDVPYPDEDFHRTINAYKELIDKYPQFPNLDSVYYLLGLALWYEGAFHQAAKNFQTLIARYPQSSFVEEVWFRLGEYFYGLDDYDDAINAYEKVAQNPKSKLYDQALYKIAWSEYQKDRYMKAAEYFEKVLASTYQESAGTAASMRTEVTRYLVKSFAEQLLLEEGTPKERKKPKKVSSEKQKKDKLTDKETEYAEMQGLKLAKRIVKHFATEKPAPYVREILIETASQLLDESKINGAIFAFESIIDLDKNHPDNPKIATQIVEILQEADRQEEARARNQAIIKQYGRESAWYKAQGENYQALNVAKEAVRDAMLALAVYYHKTGKDLKLAHDDNNADENFKKAAALYAAYVRAYPEREDTPKAVFYFAESEFELNRFRVALEAYQLLKDYPLPMPENFRRDATLNIVFTFRHVLESEGKDGRFKVIDFDNLTSKQRGQQVEEIPALGKKYLDAIDEFIKIAPKDEQVPLLLFHAAAIYYVYGHLEEALSRFYAIIANYPQTTAASVSARLILDDAVAQEQWAKVIELSKRFSEQNLGGKGQDFLKIEGNAKFKIARGVFEEANELKKNNLITDAKEKYKEASLLFGKLLEEDPKNPNADVMLFNMARAITESGTTTMALPLYRRLYTEYPNSEYAKTARFQEALALEKMLKFGEAARAYDGIINQDPKSESAGDAMLNKALLYEAADDLPKSTQAYLEFAKRYPDRTDAPDALLTAASMYKRMGKPAQQIAMLEQFIKQYSKDNNKIPSVIEAHVQIADTYADLEKTAPPALKKRYEKDRTRNYQAAVRLYSPELKSPIAAFFAAKALLILEKPEQDAFKHMTIKSRVGKTQGEELTAMMKKLAELAARDEAIIKNYAQPVWNAESLRRIGALYEHLAKAMVKAPCPKDVAVIDEFACDEYTVLLEDKAAVLEGKAMSAYKQAYEIAMSAYDSPPELINGILAGLNRLKPGEYQRVGNLIEQPTTGGLYGEGRMLSDGRMANLLHEKEPDPDMKPTAEETPKLEEIPKHPKEEAPKKEKKEEAPKGEEEINPSDQEEGLE